MTREEFNAEMQYQTLMYFAKQMLHDGAITPEEYESFCFQYADRFKPKTGSLVARNEVLRRKK